MSDIEVNGRRYRLPNQPVVVVCVDGSAREYHETAIDAGRMPFLASALASGADLTADCAMPSFTNPNNISIATGVPPAVHGISGNYYYDPGNDVEVLMNDPALLRAPTIFAEMERAGVDVAVVTAKDKLRLLLGAGLERGTCFSAEEAQDATVDGRSVLDLVGLATPSVYSGALSEFVMAAGVRLLETTRPQVMYLSLSDYLQHKYAPDDPEVQDFYGVLDGYFARLDALGAVLVITADHGMNAKTGVDGTPSIVYLQSLLDKTFGDGATRVVLPITDPYTRHHGALGSFAFVHANDGVDAAAIVAEIRGVAGVDDVLRSAEAIERFELPADRIGDVAVVAERHVALGTTPDRHDLSQLDRPLRSHGGLAEQQVPLLTNRRVGSLPAGHRLRNFDAYWLALNFCQ